MYEEMETLANVLQSDIGQDMRVHNSTFLWFIPFVQSLMDLKDLGVAYIVEVIHHLYSEVKDVLNQTDAVCDKVTEFFLLILVSVIELHRNKKCLHLLWVSSQQWVEAVVKCAKLPTTAFARSSEKSSGNCSKGTAMISSLSLHSMPSNSVQLACVQLIRSLLKEGYQLGQQTLCKRFWDKLNLFLRGNLSLGWQLTSQETHELQTCLKQIIRNIKFKVPQCSTFVDLNPACKTPPASYKEESEQIGKKSEKDVHCLENSSPTSSKEPMKADAYQVQESILSRANNAIEESKEPYYIKDLKLEGHLSAESCLKLSSKNLACERVQNQVKISTGKYKSVKENSSCTPQNGTLRNGPEKVFDRGIIISRRLLTVSSTDSLEKVSASDEDFSLKEDGLGKSSKAKSKTHKDGVCAKLSHVIKKQRRRSISLEENLTVSSIEGFYSKKDIGGQKGGGNICSPSLVPNGILDDKNGEQKSQSCLLLKKKEVKKEKLDLFSTPENSCQIQECHVDSKDLVSLTEMTNICMTNASPFKEPVTGHELRDRKISRSTDQFSSNLREQDLSSSPQPDTLTDSQVDRDLHKLSLIAQASVTKFPSGSTEKSLSQIQRKVKDEKRCFTANQNIRETCCGQVIIISDSDDDEDEERILGLKKQMREVKACIEKECPEQHTSIANTNVEQKVLIKEENPVSLLEFEESDSQFFEFETPCEVFSVWHDQKPDKNSAQENEKNPCSTHVGDSANDLGYETDYVPEEVIKKVAENFEERTKPRSSSTSVEEFCEIEVKKPKRRRYEKPIAEDPLRPSSSSVKNEDQSDILNKGNLSKNDFKGVDARSTVPSSSVQRNTVVSPKKSLPKPRMYSKPVRKVPVVKASKKSHSDTKKGQSKSSHYISCRTTPAIVPPKKFRQCPEPTSTVEKLGLKKAPRRAFELSQRSLECIVQLRDHGKTVGVVDTRKKTKLISPQTLSVRNNKKLLTSQDLQLQRQMRSKSQQNRQRFDCRSTDTTRAGPRAAQSSAVPESSKSDYSHGGAEVTANNKGKQLLTCQSSETEPVKANQCNPVIVNGRIATNEVIVPTSEDLLDRGDLTVHHLEVATLKEGEPQFSSDIEEDDIFLTQRDPEDMDLCSQIERENDKLIEVIHGKDTVQGEEECVSQPQLESLSSTKCKYKDCVETLKNPGEYCSKHSKTKATDEDVFRKPGLPLSASKRSRPSTTKVFSSSSTSRIAGLSKSLESTAALPSSLKNKSSGAQSVLKGPQPPLTVSLKPVAEVKGLCNVFPAQTPNNSNRQVLRVPFGESRPFLTSSPVNILTSSQSISDTFVKEVLKWRYEMFVNFDQCGPPSSLCQSIERRVPIRFQDCGDYFNVFFPLMVLNTFETVSMYFNHIHLDFEIAFLYHARRTAKI